MVVRTPNGSLKGRSPISFRWSHQSPLHRTLVRIYNRLAGLVPFELSYRIGTRLRQNRYPYRLLQTGSTVIQVGAPADTLAAGRSRAAQFAKIVGPEGCVIVVEPSEQSERAFAKIAPSHPQIRFVRSAVWNSKKTLVLYADPEHPATNFTEGTVDYPPERLREFTRIELDCDTLDALALDLIPGEIDLVSITTNGAEIEALEGMSGLLGLGVRHISVPSHEHLTHLPDRLADLGFEPLALDDRGTTFRRGTNAPA